EKHYFEKPFERNLNPNQFTIFSASKVLPSNSYKALLSSRDEYKEWYQINYRKRGFILYSAPDSNNWSFWTGKGNDWNISGDTQDSSGTWSIQNLNYKDESNGKRLFLNNRLNAASSQGMSSNDNTAFRVGVGKNESTPDYFFKGDIGEIIMYKKVVNEAQRIIIDNYLSAKYNIPLADNNFYTHDDGNKIYDHHVAGIGKTTGTNIHSDSQGTGIVRINNPSSLPDNSFLFWGEDTKNPTYHFTTNNHNYSEQLASKWRVSKIGDIGHVAVSFDVSNMYLSGWNGCKELQLVVANNSNFTSPRVYSLTVAGNNAAASNVVFNDGDYFTIRYVHQIVWDGNRYFNGSRPDQAPNNDSDKCLKLLVKAGNKAVLIENAYVREIEVQAGAVLEVKDGVELSVQDKIVNNGTIDLLGEAQLIQEHVGISQNSGLGKLKIRQQGTTNLYNYNYWSAPVNTDGSWQIKFLEQNNGPI